MNAIDLIPAKRIIPVVVLNDAAHAIPLAEALVDSGIESIEVTLRTSAAISAITCLLYTSPSPRDRTRSRMPSSA